MISSKNTRVVVLRLLVMAAHLIVTCHAEEEDGKRRGGSPWGGGAARQRREETMNWRDYAFMVFRYGLFIFIICFPFWRGIRVWYLAGGRVRWRRSERGWITGIRFQPPELERWLHLQGYTTEGTDAIHPRTNGPRKLTADEVYELPEITYTKPETEDDEEHDIEQGTSLGDNDELAVTYHGKDETTSNNAKTDDANDSNDTNESNDSAVSPDNESAPASATTPSSTQDSSTQDVSTQDVSSQGVSTQDGSEDPTESTSAIEMTSTPSAAATRAISQLYTTTTISTSCSICIEDFCEGEKIRLLPCGHAFHTECILPWLTERQGCCPCCKEPVIKEDKENNNNNEEGENNPQTNSNETNNNNETAGRSSYMLGSRNYYAALARPSSNITTTSALGGNMWALPRPRPQRNQQSSDETNSNEDDTNAVGGYAHTHGNLWALTRPPSMEQSNNETNDGDDANAVGGYAHTHGNLWALTRPPSMEQNTNETNNDNENANTNNQQTSNENNNNSNENAPYSNMHGSLWVLRNPSTE